MVRFWPRLGSVSGSFFTLHLILFLMPWLRSFILKYQWLKMHISWVWEELVSYAPYVICEVLELSEPPQGVEYWEPHAHSRESFDQILWDLVYYWASWRMVSRCCIYFTTNPWHWWRRHDTHFYVLVCYWSCISQLLQRIEMCYFGASSLDVMWMSATTLSHGSISIFREVLRIIFLIMLLSLYCMLELVF